MNKQHWDNFYKKGKAPLQPTEFAKFCLRFIPKGASVVDLGCGNGRDTYFFAKQKNILGAEGIDVSANNKWTSKARFEKEDFKNELDFDYAEVIYSRFFIHSIDTFSITRLLEMMIKDQYFMAEFRVKGDEPKLYKDHKRNLVDSDWFLQLLMAYGFEIIYFEKGKGMAKYKTEDPLVIRVISKKK
jgi:ubiquinone/menaquinone biosynthesis C-methylase UbiE